MDAIPAPHFPVSSATIAEASLSCRCRQWAGAGHLQRRPRHAALSSHAHLQPQPPGPLRHDAAALPRPYLCSIEPAHTTPSPQAILRSRVVPCRTASGRVCPTTSSGRTRATPCSFPTNLPTTLTSGPCLHCRSSLPEPRCCEKPDFR
jgi:hypothetical protein